MLCTCKRDSYQLVIMYLELYILCMNPFTLSNSFKERKPTGSYQNFRWKVNVTANRNRWSLFKL